MKELKQIGCVHFYVPDDSEEIFSIINGICKDLSQFVSAVRCERFYGEVEFKYSFSAFHYSIKCSFNKHHMLLMDIYDPIKNIKPYGVPFIDWQKYNDALYETQQISILQNKVLKNVKATFTKINSK